MLRWRPRTRRRLDRVKREWKNVQHTIPCCNRNLATIRVGSLHRHDLNVPLFRFDLHSYIL